MKACMGGWCFEREWCPHYLVAGEQDPEDRLCVKGRDGVGKEVFVRLLRPASSWEKARAVRAHTQAAPESR